MADRKKSSRANWKPVPGFEDRYKVSDKGQVYSATGGGMMRKVRKDKDGYPVLDLRKNGKRKTVKVHRLVSQTFNPKFRADLQVNHDDGVKTNNSRENLDMKTPSENSQHSHDTGLQGRYTNGGRVKAYSRRKKSGGVTIVKTHSRKSRKR